MKWMKWNCTAASESGCIVSGIVSVAMALVWIFKFKSPRSSLLPIAALVAAGTCGVLFYLAARSRSNLLIREAGRLYPLNG